MLNWTNCTSVRATLALTSDRGFARFAGADADDLLDRGHEDLAVADLAGARGLDDRVDRLLDHAVGNHHLDLDLGKEVDDVLGSAIELRMALLPAETLDLGDGEAGHAELGQRLAHFVELERLNDRFDLLHGVGSGAFRGKLYTKADVIGTRQSLPNARGVMRMPTADCRRLYSLRLTRRTTSSTVDAGKPAATISRTL